MIVKKWGPLVALLALAAVSVTGLVIQNPKPHNQAEPVKTEQGNRPTAKPQAESAAKPDDTKGKEKKDWYEPFFEKPSDSLLVLFTGILAVYTARLYWATAKLADADRPHIFPGHFSITGMKADGPVELGFNFENSGRSPAYLQNIIICVRQGFVLPKRIIFDNPAIVEIPFGLAPGKVFFPAGNAKAEITVPANIKAMALSAETTLFVYGCVNFEETQGSKHFQRFAYRYAPATDELVNCGPSQYWGHS